MQTEWGGEALSMVDSRTIWSLFKFIDIDVYEYLILSIKPIVQVL